MTHLAISPRFDLRGRVAIITGGAGLLGLEHAAAIAEAGGTPILWDIDPERGRSRAREIEAEWNVPCRAEVVDVTNERSIQQGLFTALGTLGRIDILINNAARDPKVDGAGDIANGRIEKLPLDVWNGDIAVGLTGAFLCSRLIGPLMANQRGGVILNVASDLGLIAPDQRLYRKPGLADDEQPVKPVTYSVIKHGVVGLTKYLATYWCERGVRVNALCPGGVEAGQSSDFITRLSNLVPLGRMARKDEYRGAIQFLCSDASSYMTGACLSIDGGRTCW